MPILPSKYTNDCITRDKINYYYFPIDHTTLNETVILMNKTQIFGTDRNGDSVMYMNVQ